MKCIIIEDQPPAQRILKKYIGDLGSLDLQATFSNAIEAMTFLRAQAVDLIFLDIHLPKISGIDFLKSLPHPPHVILTTAFPDYALESYDLNVVDYLLKPFSFQRFVKAVARIPAKSVLPKLEEQDRNTLDHLFIKSGYEHIKIITADILYIKSDADYTELFLVESKKYLSSESLRYWSENLDPQQFMRVHKSYIINTAKIVKIASNHIYLPGEVMLPIGRAYKEEFVARFLQ
jgi:DNA-binding LytR/AlgR family response regulator